MRLRKIWAARWTLQPVLGYFPHGFILLSTFRSSATSCFVFFTNYQTRQPRGKLRSQTRYASRVANFGNLSLSCHIAVKIIREGKCRGENKCLGGNLTESGRKDSRHRDATKGHTGKHVGSSQQFASWGPQNVITQWFTKRMFAVSSRALKKRKIPTNQCSEAINGRGQNANILSSLSNTLSQLHGYTSFP